METANQQSRVCLRDRQTNEGWLEGKTGQLLEQNRPQKVLSIGKSKILINKRIEIGYRWTEGGE